MSTTETIQGAPPRPPVREEPAAAVRQRRRPAMVGLGVALVAVFGLLGGWLATAGRDTHSVVVVRSGVPAGQQIVAEDLGTAQLDGAADVASIPADRIGTVVGTYPLGPLPEGAVLTSAMVTSSLTPAQGSSVIGVGLTPRQMPALGVAGGDTVRLVVTVNPQGSTAGLTPGTSWDAVVVDVGPAGEDGARTVDFRVSSADAAPAVSAAGSGAVAVVLDPQAPAGKKP